MKLFNKFQFITFTSIGLFYDVLGSLIIGLLYSPIIANPYATQGNIPFALMNPKQYPLTLGMVMIASGFVGLLVDNILDIYELKRELLIKIFRPLLVIYSIISIICFLITIYIKYRLMS